MKNRRIAMAAVVALIVVAIPIQAMANPPIAGSVIEGTSVPGGAIGDTRAQIDASFGDPSFCQSITAGDAGFCTYNTSDGSVSVRYVGNDGGDADASPNDQVHSFNWSGYSGWSTGVEVSTASTPEEVVAAYPDATHTVGSFGFESVVSLELGFSWTKTVNPYFGSVRISMSIFPGSSPDPDPEPDPDPDPGPTVLVDNLSLQLSRNSVVATVTVVDDAGAKLDGAGVSATWTLPDGSSAEVEGTTNRRGQVKLSVARSPGTFTITISDVSFDGHTFGGGDLTATIQA